ncbi:hypothetical protein Tco_1577247 [Tanacetum coccineum]
MATRRSGARMQGAGGRRCGGLGGAWAANSTLALIAAGPRSQEQTQITCRAREPQSSSSKSPRDYSQKYQRAILEPWRQSHGLPPSPPSPPPTRTTPTSPRLK